MSSLIQQIKSCSNPADNPVRARARETWAITHDYHKIAQAREALKMELDGADGDDVAWALSLFDQVIKVLRERAQAEYAERVIAKYPRRTLSEWVESLDID